MLYAIFLLMTYDIINDVRFHYMLKVLEPRYSPPDRKMVANTYFPKLYEAEREKGKTNL